MNNNFNVIEFAALQTRASQIFNNTLENIRQVQSACAEISGIVASEDSGLAGSWSNMSQTLNEPINSSNMIFEAINNAMTQYAVDVISNEEKESKNLEEYKSSISALSASAMALVNGGTVNHETSSGTTFDNDTMEPAPQSYPVHDIGFDTRDSSKPTSHESSDSNLRGIDLGASGGHSF